MMPKAPKALVWLDLETTGTDEHCDRILEIAIEITSPSLGRYDDKAGVFTAILDPTFAWDRLRQNTFVLDMHRTSGLLSDLETGGELLPSDSQVESAILMFLARFGGPHELMLAGSGVSHFDRQFLKVWMPRLERYLQYPSLDVGVIRRFCEMNAPWLVSGANDGKTHRALVDVDCHIREAQDYRALFVSMENAIKENA